MSMISVKWDYRSVMLGLGSIRNSAISSSFNSGKNCRAIDIHRMANAAEDGIFPTTPNWKAFENNFLLLCLKKRL
ncbi:hypothetical protein DAI22_04g130300 [Oryza sativa Japonica Group]|nr:hypothetical protein DAI22_04g130300 [Oryza sativa Japonica Group]